jgi:hypothetical protein
VGPIRDRVERHVALRLLELFVLLKVCFTKLHLGILPRPGVDVMMTVCCGFRRKIGVFSQKPMLYQFLQDLALFGV